MRQYIFLIFIFFSNNSFSQIIGGELFLKKINETGFNYELGMTNYFNAKIIKRGWNYSNYFLRIYKKSDKTLVSRLEVVKGPDTELNNTNKACTDSLGIDYYGIPYRKKFFLNPNDYDDPAGYFIKYDECCRQHDVKNINNSDSTSIVYYGEFPSLKLYPEFSSPNFPMPDFQIYCVNTSFSSAFGAIPSSGLTHKYYLDDPLTGYTTFNSPTNPKSTSLIFNPINWKLGYSKNKPFNGSPTLSIDENTGVVYGHSVETGHFVFSLKCDVFKGNLKLGSFKRDFTLTFVNCNGSKPNKPTVESDSKIITSDLILCNASTIKLFGESLSEFNYFWKNNGKIISNGSDLIVSKSGIYELVKSPKNSCKKTSSSDTIKVVEDNLTTKLKIINDSLKNCVGDSKFLKLNNSFSNVSWFKNDIFISNGPSVFVNSNGLYKAQINGYLGCNNLNNKDSVNIIFDLKPNFVAQVSNYSYCNGDNLVLKANINSQYFYQWLKDGNKLNSETLSSLNINQIGNYQVIIKNKTCVDTSEYYKVVSGISCGGIVLNNDLYIPTAFSPDSDGINNNFEIFNLDQYSSFELFIYNRWGELVYKTDKTNYNSWNGYYKGNLLPSDTYVYKLKMPTFELKGNVRLFR